MAAAVAFAVLTRFDSAAADCVTNALARVGAEPSDFEWPSLALQHNEQRVLATAADGLARRTIATHDLDELKLWIGASDADIRAGLRAPTPQHPATARPGTDLLNAERLDPGQQQEVSRAMRAYVFGDSANMLEWREVIDRHCSPFVVDIVTADEISLARNARLVLTGNPVLFIAHRLDVKGGTFVSTVDGHYAFGEVHCQRTRGGAA
jgi:hypothetical protein